MFLNHHLTAAGSPRHRRRRRRGPRPRRWNSLLRFEPLEQRTVLAAVLATMPSQGGPQVNSATDIATYFETDFENAIAESDETNNTYSRTFTVVEAALPDLTPYQPQNWSDKIVVSTVPGTNTDAAQFTTDDTLYIDWAVGNLGEADTEVPFRTRLLLNDSLRDTWVTNPPLNPDWFTSVTDFQIGPLAAGTYTLRVEADFEKAIAESDETNNTYSRTFTVQPAGFDWGDAPAPYPTLAAHNGPSHPIVPGILLGTLIDGEADGHPDPHALGDDNDILDDEEGIVLAGALAPASLAAIQVTTTGTGFLQGWIDFNRDGDWNDSGEQIFRDLSLSTGTRSLSFAVPASAVPGTTYARFRYSTEAGLGPTGASNRGGEVEDYRVDILSNIPIANDDAFVVEQNSRDNVFRVLDNDIPSASGRTNMRLDSIGVAGASGTVVIDRNGTPNDFTDDFIRYTPAPGAIAPDAFTYTIRDVVSGQTDAAAVSVAVLPSGPPWQNPDNVFDVSADGWVSPLDALLLIRGINAGYGGPLPAPMPGFPPPYYDVDGDGCLTPLDVLSAINQLNRLNFDASEPGELPAAVDDSYILTLGGTIDLDVLQNDLPGPAGYIWIPPDGIDTAGTFGDVQLVTVDGQQRIRYSPDGFTGADQFRYTVVDGDHITSTATVTIRVAPHTQDDIVKIWLETTDLNGNPISQIGQGLEFQLRAYVDDVRGEPGRPPLNNPDYPVASPDLQGVFSAYMDLLYDAGLIAYSGDAKLSFGPQYSAGQSVESSVPGILNEVGALQGGSISLGPDEQLLYVATFTATAQGTVNFRADPADLLPLRETVVHHPERAVDLPRIDYGVTSIQVVEAPTLVQIRLTATDPDGNPLPNNQIEAGNDFLLNAFVQDVRAHVPDSQKGVFSAYLDVFYPQTLARPVASAASPFGFAISFGPLFPAIQKAEFLVANGIINEVGALQDGPPVLSPHEQLLFSAHFTALSPPGGLGTLLFQADPADLLPIDETSLIRAATGQVPDPGLAVLPAQIAFVPSPPITVIGGPAPADGDADGITDDVENAAPNGGDGNLDGVPDAEQRHVTSLLHPGSGTYVTLVAPEPVQLQAVSFLENPWPADAPDGMQFVLDLLSLTLDGTEPGGAVVLEAIVHDNVGLNAFYGCGPTSAYAYDHWYPFLFNGGTGATMAADGRIELHLVDGGRGDHDLAADGRIAVVAAPAVDGRASPWQNFHDRFDVDMDYVVRPLDVLTLINQINREGVRLLQPPPVPPDLPRLYLDVNGDNVVSAQDVLHLINDLNFNGIRDVPPVRLGEIREWTTSPTSAGEGEAAAVPAALQSTSGLEAQQLRYLENGAAVQSERGAGCQPQTRYLTKDRGTWLPRRDETAGVEEPSVAQRRPAGRAEWDRCWAEEIFGDRELETALESIAESLGQALLLGDSVDPVGAD